MGYNIPVIKEYAIKHKAEIHVLHWDHKKLTPYTPPLIKNVFYYKRSEFNNQKLKEFVIQLKPDIVYVSGWMDQGYLMVVRLLRKKGLTVVTGLDGFYRKTLKQIAATLFFPFVRTLFYSHIWVAGPYQYEFAKRLGFKNNEIIFNFYSADIHLFNEAYKSSLTLKEENYPHRFLFVGRFEHVKGIDVLIQAWENLKEHRKDWKLSFIGNGSYSRKLKENSDILVLDFLQPEKLINEISSSGCFVLPSRFEPWGVVLHEFAAAGLPIICSDNCGASPFFIIPNFNGYIFNFTDIKTLEDSLLKIINTPDEELLVMSRNSHVMGQRITPEISAASFVSLCVSQ